MKSIFILFDNIINLYIWVLIINVIMTWLVAFNVLNTSNRFVYSVLDVTHKLTDPPLNLIRRYLPNLGSIDISPIILILALMFLRNLVLDLFSRNPEIRNNLTNIQFHPNEQTLGPFPCERAQNSGSNRGAKSSVGPNGIPVIPFYGFGGGWVQTKTKTNKRFFKQM